MDIKDEDLSTKIVFELLNGYQSDFEEEDLDAARSLARELESQLTRNISDWLLRESGDDSRFGPFCRTEVVHLSREVRDGRWKGNQS